MRYALFCFVFILAVNKLIKDKTQNIFSVRFYKFIGKKFPAIFSVELKIEQKKSFKIS